MSHRKLGPIGSAIYWIQTNRQTTNKQAARQAKFIYRLVFVDQIKISLKQFKIKLKPIKISWKFFFHII